MHDSIWFHTIGQADRDVLCASDPLPPTAGAVIVGAGLIGLSTAYYLLEAGLKDICVVDRGPALGEASGANAGGLWFAQQSPELGPVSSLSKAGSALYDELAGRFPFELERCGLLQLLFEDSAAEVDQQFDAVRGAGFRVEKLGGKEARSLEPGLGVTPAGALFYPDEGHVHPAKLGAAWVRHLRSQGVRLCLGCEVGQLRPKVETAHGAVESDVVVIASGAWTPLVTRALGWCPPIKPMRGTLLALEAMPKTLHHALIGKEFYFWQMEAGPLAGGGSVDDVGFQQGVEQATTDAIRAEMNRLLPAAANVPTARAWSGFRPYCEDLKPVIGRVPGHQGVFVAAGHFKKGVMMAPVTGKILADLITRGATDLDIEPLDPGRFRAESGAGEQRAASRAT
jgi:glycine/D-amino acid oxidase-like deaminating enzyme